MVQDADMTDAAAASKNETPAVADEPKPEAPSVPPLQASALRLERLLGGPKGVVSNESSSYTNPVKVIRRWLATSSGAAADSTAQDIQAAAKALLDPNGVCAQGRRALLGDAAASEATTMEIDGGADSASGPTYLAVAAREVESWLISLAVRVLWKEKNYTQAFEMSQQGIAIIMTHLEEASNKITSVSAPLASSLFPLLARLYRLRSLTTEAIKDPALNANLRVEMARAHNLATLRRDVDTQATLLNCMLRDLLEDSQGMSWKLFALVRVADSVQRAIAHFKPCVSCIGSRASTKAIEQCHLSGDGIQQSALSLPLLQRPGSGATLGVHALLFQLVTVPAQSAHQYWRGISHCGSAALDCRATPHGRDSRTPCILYQGHEDRTISVPEHYTGCASR